ncbi:MAG TPA: hypothetical protein VF588_08950 [Pyrinomonadaceae bacterium]|jgi:hypothetical protein
MFAVGSEIIFILLLLIANDLFAVSETALASVVAGERVPKRLALNSPGAGGSG